MIVATAIVGNLFLRGFVGVPDGFGKVVSFWLDEEATKRKKSSGVSSIVKKLEESVYRQRVSNSHS